jgi:large subunit ribosomal protein L21
MFAVVKSGGKQYRVREGEELVVDRVRGEVGENVELPVGFSVDGTDLALTGRTAKVEILEHLRGEKIHVYKYKPKKDYRKKTGHRQELTRIKVLEVSDGS